MKPRLFKSSFMLAIVLAMVFTLVGTVGAQEGRFGQTKGGSLSLQSLSLAASASIDDTLSPAQLAGLLVGTGPTAPTISNVTFTGDVAGSGSFSSGTGNVGLESGIVLSSGRSVDVTGPNVLDNTTTDFGLLGDSDLDSLIPGFTTFDATVLEFDFECPTGTSGGDVISFRYVFTSEEYNEFVNSPYNDVFGFFLNGTNIALLPDGVTPVSINNVNNGYSGGGGLPGTFPSNPAYYINNDLNDGGPFVDIEADGLTVVLGAESSINPGVANHLRLAIADAGDHVLDSWVFIEEGSFVCESLNQPPVADPNGPYLFPLLAGPFDGTGSSDPDGDSLTYDWDWGDGSTSSNAGATPSHTYASAGIYDICLTVDDGALQDTACTYAVIYDPGAGFVTGGGWIDSPVGAYVADPTLAGRANFGFVSKYQRGATVPSGNTEFQFHAAGMNFHSESYEWLVVTGGNYARFKGMGAINGGLAPNGNPFKFMVWAGDGSPDTFRIRIWWEDIDSTEHVVYDNGANQPISGGSIVIHTRR